MPTKEQKQLIADSGYFNTTWYAEKYPDVGIVGLDPLDHFLRIGIHMGREPGPNFHEESFREFIRKNEINLEILNKFIVLSHSLKTAHNLKKNFDLNESQAIQLLEGSQYFDSEFYIRENPDVRNFEGSPVKHYLQYGWKEGRRPSLLFDSDYYIKIKGEHIFEGLPPLLWFLINDLNSGLLPNRFGIKPKAPASAPKQSDWNGVRGKISTSASIDVVIPVYRGFDETLRCIYSVLCAKTKVDFNLVVLNDCSPDIELSTQLKELQTKNLFELIVNTNNLGFVKTVNSGMQVHNDRDIILLNSDTEVYDFWIDRILKHAEKDQTIATITPFSNNATICSYPNFVENNTYQLECNPEKIGELAFRTCQDSSVDIPTGVGFCFYIRRKALEDVGFFDEESFGRGYGEENDFCFRAKKAGWKNIHALDTYVYHHGETSFAETASASQVDGLRALVAKHPEYLSEIDSFIKQDPARHARRRIDIERIKQSIPNGCAIFFSHDWGGGIEKHVNDLSDFLAKEGIDVVLLHSIRGETTHFGIKKLNDSIYLPNLNNIDINDAGKLLEQFLRILEPRFLHIHSLIGFNKSSRSIVTSVIGSSRIPYYYTFHDYTPICQHAQFVRPDRQYCGEPDVATCQKCVDQYKPYFGRENVLEYQNNYRDFLLGASGLIAPSIDTQSRANRFLKINRCEVIEHFEELKINSEPSHAFCASKNKLDSEVRVAVLGAIGPQKGNDVILACQADAVSRKLPISYKVIGYCDKKEQGGIRMPETGPYSDIKDAIHEIKEFAPTLMFYPSIWPETFSYTLSVAFMLNIPPLVFDLGAPAERVRTHSFGKIIPSIWIKNIQQINDFILSEQWSPLQNRGYEKMMDSLPNNNLCHDKYKKICNYSGRRELASAFF